MKGLKRKLKSPSSSFITHHSSLIFLKSVRRSPPFLRKLGSWEAGKPGRWEKDGSLGANQKLSTNMFYIILNM